MPRVEFMSREEQGWDSTCYAEQHINDDSDPVCDRQAEVWFVFASADDVDTDTAVMVDLPVHEDVDVYAVGMCRPHGNLAVIAHRAAH